MPRSTPVINVDIANNDGKNGKVQKGGNGH